MDGSLAFGNGTIIKLYQNWTLDRGITFGSDAYAMGQEMILDLNGYTIDMSDTQSHIYLQGSTGSTLRICNGRLLNLFGSSSLQGQESTKIILQDVEIGLTRSTTEGSESYTFSNDVELEIQGNCILFGKAGRLFQNDSDASFTIASGSKLTILDGITYSHHNDGNNFVMQDRSSCLELVGGTFKASLTEGLPLTLSTGTLIVDHKSTMDVDNSDIIFDQSLQVHIRPSAAINISGHGALEYNSIP